MAIRFQLGEADQQKYPRGDEWFTYPEAHLRDMTARELVELEEHMPLSIATIEAEYFGARSYTGVLGIIYLSRRLAGITEKWETLLGLRLIAVAWRRFDPEAAPDPTKSETPAEVSEAG